MLVHSRCARRVMLGIMATLASVVTGVTKTDMLDAGDEEGEEGAAPQCRASPSRCTPTLEKSTKE